MKRPLAALPLVFLLILVAPLHAAIGTTDADAFGIELCPQSICGSAIFAGILNGEVAGIQASPGSFAVSVTHEDLPTSEGDTAAITGGSFQLRASTRTFKCVITGGTLVGTNDPDVFGVTILLASPRTGALEFDGVLSHKTFPPTISGHIYSVP
jgi:hypothetical protein